MCEQWREQVGKSDGRRHDANGHTTSLRFQKTGLIVGNRGGGLLGGLALPLVKEVLEAIGAGADLIAHGRIRLIAGIVKHVDIPGISIARD